MNNTLYLAIIAHTAGWFIWCSIISIVFEKKLNKNFNIRIGTYQYVKSYLGWELALVRCAIAAISVAVFYILCSVCKRQ